MVEPPVVVMCAFLEPENKWMFPWYNGRTSGPYGYFGLFVAVVVSSLLRRLIGYVVRRWGKEVTRDMDPDYFSVCIYAIFVTSLLGSRGLQLAIETHGSDMPRRIRHPSHGQPWFEEMTASGSGDTAFFFVAYLIDDFFSRKMTFDIVLHHVLFIYYCAVGSGLGLFPYIGCAFMAGEISTPFLSLRDILVRTGRNNVRLDIINFMFAITFFIFRVCLWTYGVYWHFLPAVWSQWDLMPQPTWISAIQVVLSCTVPGLQYYWFSLLVMKTRKRMKKGKSNSKKET